MKKHYLLVLLVAAGSAAAGASAQNLPTSPKSPLSSGDWVGQMSVGDSALFVRARFTSASPGVSGSIDVPQRSNWDLALLGVRLDPPSLAFAFVLGGDTARFEGLWGQDGIRGTLLIGGKEGTLELIRRISFDSARPLSSPVRFTMAPASPLHGVVALPARQTMEEQCPRPERHPLQSVSRRSSPRCAPLAHRTHRHRTVPGPTPASPNPSPAL